MEGEVKTRDATGSGMGGCGGLGETWFEVDDARADEGEIDEGPYSEGGAEAKVREKGGEEVGEDNAEESGGGPGNTGGEGFAVNKPVKVRMEIFGRGTVGWVRTIRQRELGPGSM